VMRAIFVAVAVAAAAFIVFAAVHAQMLGHESARWQAAQTAAAFVAALASAAAMRRDDALVRSSVVCGGILVCAGLLFYEASRALNDGAALPLASAGAYLLLLGCAAAAYARIAGIPHGQR